MTFADTAATSRSADDDDKVVMLELPSLSLTLSKTIVTCQTHGCSLMLIIQEVNCIYLRSVAAFKPEVRLKMTMLTVGPSVPQ